MMQITEAQLRFIRMALEHGEREVWRALEAMDGACETRADVHRKQQLERQSGHIFQAKAILILIETQT